MLVDQSLQVVKLMDREAQKYFATLEGLAGQCNKESYDELVEAVLDASDSPKECEIMYEKCIEIYQKYMNSTVLPALQSKHGECLLRELIHRWNNQKNLNKWMRETFYWLHESFIKDDDITDSLQGIGDACFKEMVFRNIQANCTHVILQLLDEQLEGEIIDTSLLKEIDTSLLKEIIDIFGAIEAGCIVNLEKEILNHIREFCATKASMWIFEIPFSNYFDKVEKCVRNALKVCRYLRSTNEQSVLKIIRHEFVVVYWTKLNQNEHDGFLALVRDEKWEDLSRLFRLVREVPICRSSFALKFRELVTAEGNILMKRENAVQTAEDDQVVVRELIKLHQKYKNIMVENFDDPYNYLALQGAMMEICSSIPNIAIALAIFLDNFMKRGVLENIDTVVQVIRCIKDVQKFAEIYRHRLANRLLFNPNASLDFEVTVISKLNEAIGGSFTRKMEIMLKDLTASKELLRGYGEHWSLNPDLRFGNWFSVKVLTQSQWPRYKAADIKLPKDMVKWIESFAEFYKRKWKHRKLEWYPSMGTCILEVKLQQKKYELHLSTYQAALLLLFNDADSFALSHIKTHLGLTDDMLSSLVSSPTRGKYNILKKCPNPSVMELHEEIALNSKFTAEEEIIMFPHHKLGDEKALQTFRAFKPFTIKAALIRIAKCKGSVCHAEIINECKKLVIGFEPSIKEIKREIESLIEDEYLKRTDVEGEVLYHYQPE